MFISHLAFFISVLALVLFFLRWVEHQFYERLILLFIALNASATGVWLYCNFYTSKFVAWSDSFSILVENLSLILPFAIVHFIGRKIKFKQSVFIILGLIGISVFLYMIHLFIADNTNNLVFYQSNHFYNQNLFYQAGIEVVAFGLFYYAFIKKPKNTNDELFDGKFKRTFFWLFFAFFFQDLLFLIIMANSTFLSRTHYLIKSVVFEIGNGLNLIIPLLLLLLSVYINWFYLLLKLKNKPIPSNAVSWDYNRSSIQIINLHDLPQQLTWNELLKTFQSSHPVCLKYVEELTFLSKTEKMYAFLAIFEFNQKELSDALFVSIRTIETNMYRLRTKLKKEGHELSFPYLKK